jgi:ABC-2 type transport system permease protein
MRAALVDARLDATALLVLLVWGVVGTLLTARTFTWE